MRRLDRPGSFKAKPVEWVVRRLPSGDPIIAVTFETFEVRDGEEWKPTEGRVVQGDFFILKKTGAPNEVVVEMLCCQLGWGGSFQEVHGCPPQDGLVQIDVEGRDHKGKTYYQVQWIRAQDAKPRAPQGAATQEDAHLLDAKHGDAFADLAKKFGKGAKADPAKNVVEPDYGDIPF